jgi:hypothetical protein
MSPPFVSTYLTYPPVLPVRPYFSIVAFFT